VIQKAPWASDGYYGRGFVLRRQRKVAEAIRDFESFLTYSNTDDERRADVEKILRQLRGQ